MFSEAAGLYYGLHCTVCGMVQPGAPAVHGLGCLISPEHLITARHVWREVVQKYDQPVILKRDGLFRCSVVAENADADLIFLKTIHCVERNDSGKPPAEFPPVHPVPPSWGMSVGFLARMSAGREVRAAFSMASVSFMDFSGESTRPRFWGLSGGLFQKGALGGPVFTAEGNMVGLIVDSYQFRPDPDHPESPVVLVPVMSPLWPFKEQLNGLRERTDLQVEAHPQRRK